MEVLRYPHEDCKSFFHWQGWGIGPITAKLETNYELLPFESSSRWMKEAKGPFHENAVEHFTCESELTYSPITQYVIPYPSASYPYQIQIPVVANKKILISHGYCESTGYSVYLPTGKWSGNVQHSICEVGPGGLPTITTMVTGSGNIITSFTKYKALSVTPYGTTQVNVSYHLDGIQSLTEVDFNIHTILDFKTVKMLEETSPRKPGSYSIDGSSKPFFWTLESHDWLNPIELREKMSQVADTLSLGITQLPEKNFGELASDASAKMNSINLNMIEFIKDLRKPKELIPKLANLGKLKGMANEYLRAHYGILPTISDLKEIHRAVLRRKPYIDFNGFTIVQKSYSATKSEGEITYTLEQHAKLAIQNEDSGLQGAVSSLESIGVFPTLSNVWDLVPYSFVVDWFVDIGQVLERVDGIHRLLRFNIRYTTLSRKRTSTMVIHPSQDLPISGFLSLRKYHRWTMVKVPLPPLSLQPSADASTHWLEASALLLQRK